jgi:hypothetical protein
MGIQRVVCYKCGAAFYSTAKAGSCPICGQPFTLAGDPPEWDWGTFFWGAFAGLIFGAIVFTATGRQIMEALGYRVVEKVRVRE